MSGPRKKLEEGTRGICDDCGKRILKKRLKAKPFAILCIWCQREAEQKSGRSATTHFPPIPEDKDKGGEVELPLDEVFGDDETDGVQGIY